MIRLSDLSPAQIRMLIRLDDGFHHQDSVGRELDELKAHEYRTIDGLVRLGLVEMTPGRGMLLWFRLTKAGRNIRDGGRA